MMCLYNPIQIGSRVCFFEGKTDKPVAYDDNGKVILCRHDIPRGYAKIKTVAESKRYYLVTAEHVVQDLYTRIDYDEFLKVLPMWGYKIGFDREFKGKGFSLHNLSPKHLEFNEHQIFAYNLQNNVVIVAQTYTDVISGVGKYFYEIKIYLPGIDMNIFLKNNIRNLNDMITGDSGSGVTALDVELSFDKCDILKSVNQLMRTHGGKWPKHYYPALWTYEDGVGEYGFHHLKLADPECLQIFEGCDWLDKVK